MSDEIQPPKRRDVVRKLFRLFVPMLVLALLGTSLYFYYQYQRLAKSPASSQVQAEEESAKVVKAVGKLMLLPTDETPTVATITDIDKLKDQPFFKNAKNGEKVLIYPNLKQVIIYDPEANLIINVGTVNFSDQQKQPTK